MVLSSVLTFARSAAQTDSNGLGDADGVIFANEALLDFHRRLIEHGVDASQIQEASIAGTAGTGVYSYPIAPCSIIALKTITLNYANTTADQYITADQVDVANIPNNQSFGWLRSNASTQHPLFDDRGNQFEIFPTPTASHNLINLVRLFGYAKPSVYGATTDTVLYPENLDATILGYRTAANYKYSLQGADNFVAGDKLNAKYEERVDQYINTLSRGSQQPIQATPLQIDGFEF